jgi:uncharacterized protein YggL (DUF469 family)
VNKRLRKKKHLREFKELCFEISWKSESESDDIKDQLMNDFVSLIEKNNLICCGGYSKEEFSFCIAKNKGSCTEEHQQIIINWLNNNSNIIDLIVGKLVDAWYGWK